jgi:hypothetical protein
VEEGRTSQQLWERSSSNARKWRGKHRHRERERERETKTEEGRERMAIKMNVVKKERKREGE